MHIVKVPITGLFTKIGLFWSFAPFYGYKISLKVLLRNLCRDSRAFLNKNKHLLEGLCTIKNIQESGINVLIKETELIKLNPAGIISNHEVKFHFFHNPKWTTNFIEKICHHSFSELKSFDMWYLSAASEQNITELKQIFSNHMPICINSIVLDNCVDVWRYREFLSWSLYRAVQNVDISKLFPHQQLMITIGSFDLQQDDLQLIFERSAYVRTLKLKKCVIGQIDKDFCISGLKKTKIEELDLSDTICLRDKKSTLQWVNI